MSAGSLCPYCNEGYLSWDDADQLVCDKCSRIASSSRIVNESEFYKHGNGTSMKKGTFFERTFIKQERIPSETLSMGFEIINSQATKLNINEGAMSYARKLFHQAVLQKFTRGRTISIVAAAALYVAIRSKKFPDGTLIENLLESTNGFSFHDISKTAECLAQKFSLKIEVFDYNLYLEKFIEQLLDDSHNKGELLDIAKKCLKKLEECYIQTGRKPSSVVTAAILLAVKILGIPLSEEKIVRIGEVCASTINKRLREISTTELGKVSLDDLRGNSSGFEQSFNDLPPSMKKKVRAKIESHQKELDISKVEEEEEDQYDDFDIDSESFDMKEYILSPEDSISKKAIYYAMYSSKINEPKKVPKPRKPRKNRGEIKPFLLDDEDADQEQKIRIVKRGAGGSDISDDDDGGGDFDDY